MLLLTFDMLVFETLNLRAMSNSGDGRLAILGLPSARAKPSGWPGNWGRSCLGSTVGSPPHKPAGRAGARLTCTSTYAPLSAMAAAVSKTGTKNASHNILEAERRLRSGDTSKTPEKGIVSLLTAESHAL